MTGPGRRQVYSPGLAPGSRRVRRRLLPIRRRCDGPEDPIAVVGPHTREAVLAEALHPAVVGEVLAPTVQQEALVRPAIRQWAGAEGIVRQLIKIASLNEFV